ncbi:unnamed protein product [Dovyalis caffra]|uniref:Myb-like domain-containing protein n=1 Tax=Dovyalis caffra TaxID=77055 RepID=A0AAV1SYA5_9ROSI|nr:unnamed protein product [Dovyalis caffra]
MQQGGGERGSSQPQPQYGVPHQQEQGDVPSSTSTALATHMQQQQVVEEASPISSRPPATAAATSGGVMNLDEFMRLSGSGGAEEDIAGEDIADRTGGIASGNRWPRQETLALLQIRSEMDAAFRDATLKGPLWEDVSRKLAELGYKRSAKKCKEKFENVHKYYKRTKEGRAGRQDGKSYRFFSQLEALHSTGGASPSIVNVSGAAPQPIGTTTTSSLDVAPVSVGVPMPISSSFRIPPPSSQVPQPASNIGSMFPPDFGATVVPAVAAAPAAGAPVGISFSSNGSSSSPSSEDDDDDDDDDDEDILGGQPSGMAAGTSRKRKRASLSSSRGETHRMMEFFEGLMKQVMQKQEAMQQRFLEAIEKREQDRMIRDEAWKRQEMVRLSHEHEIMAQERAISASRDAAIVSFLQKITGQTIHLPTPVSIAPPVSQPPPPQPQPVQLAPLVTVSRQQQQPPPPPPQPQPQPMPQSQVTPQQNKQQPEPLPQQQQHQQQQHHQVHHQHQPPISSDIVMAVPEQQVAPQEFGSGGGGSGSEPASSRWPKAEVLALIKLRSGLETRYQEAGPKGPLWEEISTGMQKLGYRRSSKRCKEKWENINKYFKKVKESNKKRPEDAKTCPYFHELDALYRKKIIGSSSGGGVGGSTSGSGFDSQTRPQEQQQQEGLKLDPAPPPMQQAVPPQTQPTESQNKNGASVDVQASSTGLPGSLFGEGNGAKKPEDIVKELMKQQGTQHQRQHQNHQQQQLVVDDYDKMEEGDSENVNEDEYDEEDVGDEDDEDDEALQEEGKVAYKIEFQRQNTSNATNGGGNGAPSFLAMVQ